MYVCNIYISQAPLIFECETKKTPRDPRTHALPTRYILLLTVYTLYMIFLVVALGRMSRTKRQYGSGRRFKGGGTRACIAHVLG